MDAVTLTISTGTGTTTLTDTIAWVNKMATEFSETIGSNVGWLILIASAALIVGFVLYLVRKVTRLGRR